MAQMSFAESRGEPVPVQLPHGAIVKVEVEGVEEIISAREIAESEAALQDYWAGRDRGMNSAALKQKLFGSSAQ